MGNEDTEFSPGEHVIVLNLIINDKTYAESDAMVVRVINHGDFKGKYMVRVNGTDVIVTKDRLKKRE
jgi:hypothetical protein